MALDLTPILDPIDVTTGPADLGREVQSERYVQNYWPGFWLWVWAMIAVAGGVFGTLQFPLIGTIMGAFVAAFFAPPLVMTAVAVTWACWLSRLAILPAAIAGAATGVFSTAVTWDAMFGMEFTDALIWAGCIGGLGGGCGGASYVLKFPLPRSNESGKTS